MQELEQEITKQQPELANIIGNLQQKGISSSLIDREIDKALSGVHNKTLAEAEKIAIKCLIQKFENWITNDKVPNSSFFAKLKSFFGKFFKK